MASRLLQLLEHKALARHAAAISMFLPMAALTVQLAVVLAPPTLNAQPALRTSSTGRHLQDFVFLAQTPTCSGTRVKSARRVQLPARLVQAPRPTA